MIMLNFTSHWKQEFIWLLTHTHWHALHWLVIAPFTSSDLPVDCRSSEGWWWWSSGCLDILIGIKASGCSHQHINTHTYIQIHWHKDCFNIHFIATQESACRQKHKQTTNCQFFSLCLATLGSQLYFSLFCPCQMWPSRSLMCISKVLNLFDLFN